MANGDKMETEKELVRDGFAWRYVRYDKAGDFTDAEREAQEKHRGLWAESKPVPQWECRRERRGAAATSRGR